MAGELEVHYNLTSEAEGKNEIDDPTSNNRDRRRTAMRNTTTNTTTSLGTMNEGSECDSDNEGHVDELPPKKKQKQLHLKNLKRRHCVVRSRRR